MQKGYYYSLGMITLPTLKNVNAGGATVGFLTATGDGLRAVKECRILVALESSIEQLVTLNSWHKNGEHPSSASHFLKLLIKCRGEANIKQERSICLRKAPYTSPALGHHESNFLKRLKVLENYSGALDLE